MSKKKYQKQAETQAVTEVKKKPGLSTDNKLSIIYILILLFAFVPTYKHIYDSKIAFLGDNAAYYVFGRALANGDGYVNVFSKDRSPVISYPPGYPALIAVEMKFFGESIDTVKKANGVLYFLALLVLFFFFRAISKNIHLSFILTLIILFNYYLLQYSTWMMSEIPFIFFTSLALWMLATVDLKANPLKQYRFYLMLISMLIAHHVRSQGIALFGGVFLFLLVQRNWKYLLAVSTAYIGLIIPWMIRNSKLHASPYQKALTYKNYYDTSQGKMSGIGDWLDRFGANFERYMSYEIPSAMFGYQPTYKDGSMITGFILLAIIGFGIYKSKKLAIAVAGYILATFAILMIWPPVWTGVRFMLPIVPLLIFYFFYAIYELISWLLIKMSVNEKIIKQYIAYAFIVFALIYTPKLKILHKEAGKPLNPLFYTYFELAKWTKNNLPDDAVIMCRKPILFHLFSNHYVSGVIKEHDPDKALEIMKKGNIRYVVLYGDGLSQRYFMPLYQKYPNKFPVLQKGGNPPVYLLEVKPDAP